MMQPCPNTLKKGTKQRSHLLGWAGTILVLFGYYLNANMDSASWLVWIAGNLLVGMYCLNKKAYPTAVMSFILVFMNIYGYLTWIKS
tara:strand:- start:649 stop:909 length:261 start_codon:yes stop_codon:yes gene_type:complete